MKICPVKAELFHANSRMDSLTDRRTGSITKVIVLLQFFERAQNSMTHPDINKYTQ
jgi:hypothetical protein